MRFLSALLLFCLATSLAVGSEPVGFGTKWATAFKSFFGHEDSRIPVQTDSAEDSVHARLKRAVYAAMGWTVTCNNGWTGTYCQTPVCPGNPNPPIRTVIDDKLVDKVDLGVGCSQSYVLPVEANVFRLTMIVDTQYGKPQVILLDSNNFQVDVGGNTVETMGIFTVNNPRPGLYSLSVNLSNSQTTSFCRVTVEVTAALDVTGGFVATPQQDQFETELLYANNPSFFIAHVANVTAPGSLGAVYLRSNRQNIFDFTSALAPRFSCNYEYYAGYFTCQFGATYQWVVDGTDGLGYRFRRSSDFHCLNQPATQAPPTTTVVPPSSCLNGGTLINNTGSAPFCYCGTFFTGPTCAERICMHNGNPTSNGCDCAPGYTGPFCEHISCSTDVFNGFNTDEKTLIVVIRQSPFIATQVNDIAKAIQDHINYYGVSGVDIYSWFILVTFSNDNIQWQEYSNSVDFLTNFVKLNTTNVQTGCNDTVIDAIATVFEAEIISAKSPIIVITDAPPDDGADYLTVVNRNTFRKLPIFVFYINNPSSGCNTDQMSAGYRALQTVAHSTGGLVMTPSINNLPNAFKYTMRFVTYHSNMVLGYDYFQCSMGNHGSFFVDTSVKRIAILATGSNLSISVTDPNGNSSLVIDAVPIDSQNFIWDITGDVIPGEYLFFITSSNGATQPCNYRVYVESNYDLFYGVSNSLTTDAYFSEPIFQQSSNMVATFNGLRGQIRDQFRLYAEMQISRYNRSGALEPVYFSSGVYRDGCNYHLSFGSFVCNIPNEHLYMTVFADDPFGFPIQRTAVIYCAYEQPTEAPPNSCINGGVTNPQNTTTCLCPAHWTGQYCQNIVCENNGTAIANTYCQCPEYTAGRFCEETSCGSPATGVNFLFTHRSMAFVFNVHNTMAAPLMDIATSVEDFVRDLYIMHNLFITKFIVVTYNETMATTVKVSDDPRSFIAAVMYAAEQAQSAIPVTDPNNAKGLLDTGIKLALDESLPQSFVFAFTDAETSQDPTSDATLAWNTLNAQDLRINLNLVAVSNSISGGVNGYQFIPEHINMVEYTEGEVFYTTHPGKFLQYIPTLYKSGLMSGGESDNCNITRFMPVDYWSPAFTVYTGGQNISVKVTPPTGTAAEFENIIDQDTYLDIRQYIIPCDTGGYWTRLGQYCYNFNVISLDYTSAVADCHNVQNGHLIHIFNQDTQTALNTKVGRQILWLGLKRLGSTWVWDSPGFAQLNLTLTAYTNWDTSVNPDDTSKGDCVIMQPGYEDQPRWFVVQCSETHLTMCQKHRYNQEFEPGSDNNLLPAGLWRIDVTGTGRCGMEARIQSEIQIFYGFTTDLHSDNPQTYANLQSDQNRVIAHTTGLEPINPEFEDNVDGNLNYAFMYVNSTLIRVARFQPRARCAYRAVSQTFKCPQYGTSNTLTEMPIKFSGIDQFGNLFERIGTPYCANTIASCFNGGYLYNGFCICKDNFEGDRCQNRICRNGGFLEPNGQCRCPEETTGDSCETFVCIPPRKADFSQNNKTLAILFETSYAMTVAKIYLGIRFTQVIGNVTLQTSPNWFNQYMLYPFDSTSNKAQWNPKVYSNHPADIQNALGNITNYQCPGGNPCESGTKCPRPLLSVINDTINDPFFSPGSVILLFTQSTVEDITQYSSVIANIQRKRAQIHIILPDVSSPCSLPWTDYANRILFSLPESSGGNLFTLLSRDVTNVLLPTYLPTLYKGNVVDSLTRRNCTYDEIYVSVDTQTTEFTIVYSGLSPSVSVTDPKNQTTTLPKNLLNSVFNYYAIYKTNNLGGTYKITAQSSSAAGACLINIHATSEISVFAGYTVPQDAYNGATSDDAHTTAISDPSVKNVVILHATNLNGGYLNYVQMFTTQNFGRPQLWTAEVKPRSTNCSYEWYSVGGFTCDVPGTYQLAVYGVDAMGYNFRRSIPVDCVSDRPPRDPTPPTCNLHDRFYDIVLIIDGSTAGGFQQLKSIASAAFSPYAYNFQFTRLSIIVVNANSTLQGYLKDSDGKQGPQVVAGATSFNTTGQDLDGALKLIISEYNNPDTSGYRADARHLIVYLTRTVTFSSDPQNTLNSIKRGGMFGFVALGYNLGDNDAATLTNLSGDRCTYNGYGPNASMFMQYFIQDITCFRFPVCGE